jgi:hypothetical protein
LANELDISYPYSATLYALVRKVSDGTVWNGSAFVTFVNGDIASYGVALTSQGGDYYAANMPSAITAGTYRVQYYEQAGGTPATTDEQLDSETFYWDGTAVSGTPESDYLTSLSRVKEYLGISSSTYDTKLTNLLSAASRAIERYCDAKLVSAARTEYHNGRGVHYLTLDACPVTASPKISLGDVCVEIVNTSTSTYEATVKVDSGVLTLTRNGSDSTLTLSSYATLDLLAAAVVALGDGWAATVQEDYGDYPASRIRDTQGVLESREDSACLELFAPFTGWQRTNLETGVVVTECPTPFGYRNVKAEYTGGYTTVPDDLQTAACDLVSAMYRGSLRDATLKSEKLGDYAYTNFSAGEAGMSAGQLEALSPLACQLLRPFRRIHAL